MPESTTTEYAYRQQAETSAALFLPDPWKYSPATIE
jgi:hypothetical protein